jgi:UDP-N-acetylglucosamine diphosphorylase / glucose-1-phosphate thymidylyltransferase / UDP-N-acetylgalactosamine diphosphorylase / glucosamine-1-phosphate N-acetyltransferase / galactosamine-1-phosphate N-acetyltransferase
MINYADYIRSFTTLFPDLSNELPWNITAAIQSILAKQIKTLGKEFDIKNDVAIHKEAKVEEHVILKGPIIIHSNCFVGSHAYLRGGVFLALKSSVGPGCEIKSSFILGSSLAHFNFVGDSILGSGVNMEAGSVIANHYNERPDKKISVLIKNKLTETGIEKFGALVGDDTKIGANAVLSPGTILRPESIVKRLELVDQSLLNNSFPEYHF